VKRLKQVLQRSQAEVVLTSTWRYDAAGLLSAKHWGISFIDITPDLPHEPRRNEVVEGLADMPSWTMMKTRKRHARILHSALDREPARRFQRSSRMTAHDAESVLRHHSSMRERTCRTFSKVIQDDSSRR
jgi:hypothetical protein